jgi:NitT/TauT family transport system substrate-binding protein
VFKKIIWLVLAAGLVLMAGCAKSTSSTASPAQTTSTAAKTAASATASATPVTIKIGSLPRIYDIIAYAAQNEHLFEKYGVKVEISAFRSETEKDTAMLAGQLDGVIEGTFGAINLNKNDATCKLVGHNLMPRMFQLVVTPTSGIKDPSQLKGKDIATSTGTIMEYALDRLLASKGVDSKEVRMVDVPSMPLRLEMLTQGKMAAALFTSPLSDQAVASGNIILIDDDQVQYGGPGLIFSMDAIKNKAGGIQGFVQAWQEAVKMINADPEKYRSLIVATAKVPESLAAGYKIPVFPALRLPTQAEVDTIDNWMLAHGYISQAVPYSKAIDISFIK